VTASQPECICRDATTTTPTADGVKVKVDWTWNPLCPVHKPAAGDLAAWLTAIWDVDEAAGNAVGLTPGVRMLLARIAADRQILALHVAQPSWGDCPQCTGETSHDDDGVEYGMGVPQPCPTIRLLASPYADRPGYQEAWKP
jgi:hypothetical protein